MENVCAVILAAGDGKRMKSRHPKVMCEVLFKPMIQWVADSCMQAGIPAGCAVLGKGAEEIYPLLPESISTVLQEQRLGTGHAASMAKDFLHQGAFAHTLVLNGDAPLLSPEDIRSAYDLHIQAGSRVTVISAEVENPHGYGRILRSGDQVSAIVEERDATDAQRAIREINSGAYWMETSFLLDFFAHMHNDNSQNEYYLTDCIAHAVATGSRAGAYIAHPDAVLGANSRADLAQLNAIARSRVIARLLDGGVNIPFPDSVVIGPDCEIGQDTTILPGTVLRGKTRIGTGCEIGPNGYLADAVVGDRCRILSSQIDSSKLEDDVRLGPMSNVRPGSTLCSRVKVGDFVEVKNSVIGEKTSVAHLTYVGDSDIGARCNFGCGVVTVNYDGQGKYRTTVGDDAFIGCNTNLVAPVEVGHRVYAAAGTTITENVPDDALVIGRSRQVIKKDWVKERGKYRKSSDK